MKNSNIPTDDILSVHADEDDLIWLGTWQHGVLKFDRTRKQFQSFNSKNSELSNDNVFDIAEDTSGNLWIATQNGLNKLEKNSLRFETYTPHNSDLLYHQMEVVETDLYGNVLIGNVQGLVIFNPSLNEFTNYQHKPGEEGSLSDNFVTSIYEQDSITLWIATNYELNRLNRKTGKVSQLFMKDGLPSDIIYGIERDSEGSLWISTNRGLSRYNDLSRVFENYGLND